MGLTVKSLGALVGNVPEADPRTTISFQEVEVLVDEVLDNHQVIAMAGIKWTKQLRGESVGRVCTVDEARTFLEVYTRETKYDSRNDNCHSAQEQLRRWLGQPIPEDRPLTRFTKSLASWIPASIANSHFPH